MPKDSAIDCRFGEAKIGDILTLPGPMFSVSIHAELVAIEGVGSDDVRHVYDLSIHGVHLGKCEAKRFNGGVAWSEVKSGK